MRRQRRSAPAQSLHVFQRSHEIDRDGNLVNMALEVTLETALSDEIVIDRYALPTDPEA